MNIHEGIGQEPDQDKTNKQWIINFTYPGVLGYIFKKNCILVSADLFLHLLTV